MNETIFFNEVRADLFRGSLTPLQVEGIKAILAGCAGLSVSDTAYILATAYHETGQKMQPVTESLNYSVDGLLKTFGRHRISEAEARRYGRSNSQPANQEAIANIIYGGDWGRKNLGNTSPGDGFRFRGRGLVQITGRMNYLKFGIADKPTQASLIGSAVDILVRGMVRGIFTGRKLSDFIPGDYRSMRQVVNGLDRAGDIADYARDFASALLAAGWSDKVNIKAEPQAAAPKTDWLAIFRGIFKR